MNLFYDYRANVHQYPLLLKYFWTSGVPVLANWGKEDTIFIPPGAEPFKKDVEKFELSWLDAGQFAIETNEQEVADAMDGCFRKLNVFEE